MYADDTVLLLSAELIVSAIRSCLSLHCKVSNAKINIEKSVVIRVGNTNLENLGIRTLNPDETIKYLGIPFIINGLQNKDLFWPGIIEKMENSYRIIIKKSMLLRARVFCFNLLIISKGRFIANFIPPSAESIKKIEGIMAQ